MFMTGKEMLLELLDYPENIYECVEDLRRGGASKGQRIKLAEYSYYGDKSDMHKLAKIIWCSFGQNEEVALEVINTDLMKWKKVLSEKEKREIEIKDRIENLISTKIQIQKEIKALEQELLQGE